jgi:hypothetical protein
MRVLLDHETLDISPHTFDPLCLRLRGVSKKMREWAKGAWQRHGFAMVHEMFAGVERAIQTITPHLSHVHITHHQLTAAIYSMVVLQGTARFVFDEYTTTPPRRRILEPFVFDSLLLAADPLFDGRSLIDVHVAITPPPPQDAELGFEHITELLTQTGEYRAFVASAIVVHPGGGTDHTAWSECEPFIQRATNKYTQLQRHRWMWPQMGLVYDRVDWLAMGGNGDMGVGG